MIDNTIISWYFLDELRNITSYLKTKEGEKMKLFISIITLILFFICVIGYFVGMMIAVIGFVPGFEPNLSGSERGGVAVGTIFLVVTYAIIFENINNYLAKPKMKEVRDETKRPSL